MSEGAIVEVVSDNSGRDAYGKAISYRNGKPRHRYLIWGSMALLSLVLIPVVLVGPPSEEVVTSGVEMITLPTVSAHVSTPDISTYSRTEDLERPSPTPTARTRPLASAHEAPLKLVGPQLLKRPRAVNIPPGAMIKAELVSGASNGLVKAIVKESLVINGETLIESGAVAVGQGNSTENRLQVKFAKLVYRDGTTEAIQAEAADESDKTVGLKGSKLGYHTLRLAAGAGLNFAGGMAEGLQETEGQQGAVVKKSSMKNALLNGAATASLDQSREMMTALRNEPPLIEVPPGAAFYLLFADGGE